MQIISIIETVQLNLCSVKTVRISLRNVSYLFGLLDKKIVGVSL